MLICAFWEAFVEDLAGETLRHLAEHAASARQLPDELRKSIVKDIERQKHELAMWELADDQWRNLLRDRAERIVAMTDKTLSSPSSLKVDEFLCTQAGMVGISESWHWPRTSVIKARTRLDELVSLRNQIAHRGGPADTAVLKKDAEHGFELVSRLTGCCIAAVDQQLAACTGKPLIERI